MSALAINPNKATDAFLTNKSLLAKLLASENITIVHDPKARTAGFDVKQRILYLPVWEGVSVDVYDLFVGHEVGHAKYTREDEWGVDIEATAKKAYPTAWRRAMPWVRNLFNILEDPRIEKLMKRLYPGLRPAFARGYSELWERDFFKAKEKLAGIAYSSKQLSVYGFMDRINLHFKAGRDAAIYFSAEEQVYVDRLAALETWAELVVLAEDIIAFLKEKIQNEPMTNPPPPQPQQGPSEEGEETEGGEGEGSDGSEGEGEESESDDEGSESDADGEDTDGEGEGEESDADGETDAESEKSEGKEAESESGSDQEGDADGEADGEDEGDAEGDKSAPETPDAPTPGSEGADTEGEPEDAAEKSELDKLTSELGTSTDKALAEAAAELASDLSYNRFTAPTFNYNKIVHDYKIVMEDHALAIQNRIAQEIRNQWHGQKGSFSSKQEAATKWVTKFRVSEKQNISYMQKEFDLKKAAASHAREMTAKSGRLNMSKLHSYKFSDDLFRRNLIQNKGQSHGIVFILDFSGSMSDSIQQLLSSIMSMSMFCRNANIPFDVYIFSDNVSSRVSIPAGLGVPAGSRLHREAQAKEAFQYTRGTDIVLGNFNLRNILSSRMTLKEYNTALVNMRLLAQNQLDCDRMGGTPLLGSLLIAKDVVSKFKDTHKLDVVSLIVMTDGDSNPFEKTFDNSYNQSMMWETKPGYFVFHDPKSRRDYSVKTTGGIGGDLTKTLGALALQNLKDVVQCNVIGYFITSVDSAEYRLNDYTPKERQTFRKAFFDQGYASAKMSGYDEYFFIAPRTLAVNQEKYTGAGYGSDHAAAFTQWNKRKGYSRQILKSIVARICAQGV